MGGTMVVDEDGELVSLKSSYLNSDIPATTVLAVQDGRYARLVENVKANEAQQRTIEKLADPGSHMDDLVELANWALAERDYKDVLLYLAGIGVFPDYGGAEVASMFQNIEALEYLAGFGISLGVGGANNAAEMGHLDVVRYLAEHGILANPDDAARRGHLNVVRYLAEEHGRLANPDVAARHGHLNVVRYLAEEHGRLANPDVAERNGHLHVVEFLVNWAARKGLRRPTQRAVFALARRSGRDEEYADPDVIDDVFRGTRRRRREQ